MCLEDFSGPAPLFEELHIILMSVTPPLPDSSLFGENLPSLPRLSLEVERVPWKGLTGLTDFKFNSCTSTPDFITNLLDFFEATPLLQTVDLAFRDQIPSSGPSGRTLPLPHLRFSRSDHSSCNRFYWITSASPPGHHSPCGPATSVLHPHWYKISQKPRQISRTFHTSRRSISASIPWRSLYG